MAKGTAVPTNRIVRSLSRESRLTQYQLPTERDFDPYIGDLDGQHAWKTFGGLSLEHAREKFLENPMCYQEDFMFMGGKAFAFYFPVVEGYLKSVPAGFNDHDHEAWILSRGIKAQFQGVDLAHVRHLIARVLALADFVQGNIERFGYDAGERNRVAGGWSDLVWHLKSLDASNL